MQLFIQIFEMHSSSDKLLDELDAAEQVALAEAKEDRLRMEAIEARLRVSDLHVQLNIVVHPDEDLEHVQAVLMYAFMMPGRKTAYAGDNTLAAEHVFVNVRNKLVARYSQAKTKAAVDYLVRNGVLNSVGTKTKRAYSLNLSGKGATLHGQQILAVVMAYLHNNQ
jgi:hypothetical protein